MAGATIGMISSSSLHSGPRFLHNHSSISNLYRSSFLSNSHSKFAFSLNRHLNSLDTFVSTVASAAKMSSRFKSEESRIPPAIPFRTPPISKFKVALCQLSVTSDKERNIAHAREAIEEAAEKGAQLILLPEIWNSPYSNDSFPVYAEEIDADKSPSTAMLSELSRSLKITIIGGSIPERSGDKLYNTCCIFGTDGKLKAKHRKIHVFDIDIPGQMTFKESKTLTAGETPTIVDTGGRGGDDVAILGRKVSEDDQPKMVWLEKMTGDSPFSPEKMTGKWKNSPEKMMGKWKKATD